MTDDKDLPNLEPGPRDRGGQGGMASREYDARHSDATPSQDQDADLTDLEVPEIGRGIEGAPKA